MSTCRVNAVMAGVLYNIGTVAGVLSAAVVGGFPEEDFALQLALDPSGHTLGALLIFVMGVALASMTLFLYSVFRKDSEALALGMLIFRGPLGGTHYLITAVAWVALGADCLCTVLYRTKLIPRWLLLWGLVAAVPYLGQSGCGDGFGGVLKRRTDCCCIVMHELRGS